MPIRKKLTYLLFGGIVLAVVLTSLIALNGLRSATEQVTGINSELGTAAATESQDALIDHAQVMLAANAHDKAARVDSYFSRIAGEAMLVADAMTDRENDPASVISGEVLPPQPENAGKLSVQLFFTSDADRAALRPKIRQAASIGGFLCGLNETNPVIASAYVASEDGFIIVADTFAGSAYNSSGSPDVFDFKSRPWYQRAVTEKKLIFSDVTRDSIADVYDITCAVPYYRGAAVAGVVGVDALVTDINKIIADTNIGATDVSFIVNERGDVIFSTATTGVLRAGTAEEPNNVSGVLGDLATSIASREEATGELELEDGDYAVAFAPLASTDWSYGIAISCDELVAPARLSHESIMALASDYESRIMENMLGVLVQVVLAVGALLFIALAAGRMMAQHVTRPIETLQQGVARIASGDLDTQLEVNTHDELEELATTVNVMTRELKKYMGNFRRAVQAQERTSAELSLASSIQQSMLPNIFPPFPERSEFDIFATMQPARSVGGDFYDFYLVDKYHLIVTIADVSDKGVPAALYMMIAKTIIKNNAYMMSSPDDLSAVVTLVNKQFAENNEEMMFVTVFIAMLDLRTGRLIYVNGGHTPPLIMHEGEVKPLDVKKNCVLGIREGFIYEQQDTMLAHGDVLFCYTDGVNEAMNSSGEPFGEERLISTLTEIADGASARDIVQGVGTAIKDFAGTADQSDDITMLGLKFN